MSGSDHNPALLDPSPPQDPLPSRLLLIRHAESAWNEMGRLQGQLDSPLSPLGRRQAELLARRLAGRRPAAFYSSDLNRALETTQPLRDRWELAAVPHPGLREVNLGEWQGLDRKQIAARYPDRWAAWQRAPSWDL